MKENSDTKSMNYRGNLSYFKGGSVRPLGSVKQTGSQPNVPKFPPLHLDRSYDGIHGNAMSVPPAKEATEREERPRPQRSPHRTMGSSRSDTGSSKSSESNDRSRELADALLREKHLKQQIASLQKTIEDLRSEILAKDKLNLELQQQILEQEQKYRELFEKEEASHKETRSTLLASQLEVQKLKEQLTMVTEQHKKQLSEVEESWSSKLSTLEEEKKKEISERDEKLSRLKKQMAEALKGNSWERQQQLDELTKELSRVQEECDILKMKLKNAAKTSKSQNCANCESLSLQLAQAMRDRDHGIRDLKMPSGRQEKNHDTTLLQLTDRSQKGRKIPK